MSEDVKIKKNNFNNQRNSLRKGPSYINKYLYYKNNELFYNVQENIKNKVQNNYNINKGNNNNYKEVLSKSSFNTNINPINYNYILSNISNNVNTNNNMNNNKFTNLKSFNSQNSLKYIKSNKEKYKINNYVINNENENQNKYINKNKTEKIIKTKKYNKNNIQVNNNIKNNNNILLKLKTNSYTPINNSNCIITNPNDENQNNQNYILGNSLIYENYDDSNFRLSSNAVIKEKKINDKSCPKFMQNYSNNNYTNINNINNNNNYIVNVNKYINIINKKNRIIKKASNLNDINSQNYKSYKIINNSNNKNKKYNNEKYINKDLNIKNNNYNNSPDDLYLKKYKSINKANNIPSTNYNQNYNNKNNKNNTSKNRTNTQTENNKGYKIIEFKKLKTLNYLNRNNSKNENIYQNKNVNKNVKNLRKKFESDLKNSILDSNSFKYINKSNTNSSLKKGINNNLNNNFYNKKNKYLNKLYSESFSSSIKNLSSNQRNNQINKIYEYNTNINDYNTNIIKNERNSYYKKGRNDKYNLGIIFRPQTIGQKINFELNKIHSNRNSHIKVEKKDSKTISIIDFEKENIKKDNNINNINKNFNLIKLMKPVNEYKNKNNKSRYENNLNTNTNKNKNIKNNIQKSNNKYMTNIINNIYEKNENISFKRNIKDSHNPGLSEVSYLKAFNENKVIQNITQNTLTMYSIYIISHYFTDFNKIGLSKILLLNKNNESIPVICSNNNCGKDTNILFDISGINNKNYNKIFITEFNNNIYINFYINNIQSNNIKYIQIKNYTNIKKKISPVGKIEIFQEKKLIFKGILNSNKISNIEISNYKNEINDNSFKKNKILNDINETYILNNRPYSLSKYRSMEGDDNPNENNNLIINSEHDNFYTARGALYKGLPNIMNDYNNKNIENDNDNNYDSKIELNYDKEEDYNNSYKNNNDLDLDSLLTQKLSIELNRINNSNSHYNTYKTNKYINEKYEIYNNTNNNSKNKLSYSNSNNNINKNNVTLNNKKNINEVFFNLLRKTYNNNEFEDFDPIVRTSVFKMREYSSFNLKNSVNNKKNNIIKKLYELNNDLDINSYKNKEESFSNINLNNDNIDNIDNNIYNNIQLLNYIEFNKIRFIISSNYGHHKYVGLTGIELFNVKGEPINIESALTIGALPKDLRTLYNDEKENRIFENVFNKINNTNDSDNMWVTKLKKNNPLPFIELYFKEKLRISKIRIYNYNERDKLNIGAKTIELYLDDEYYNTIYLKQGTGEIARYSIIIKNNKINQDNNELFFGLDESDIYNNEDFGQDITFPIIDISQNDLIPLKNTLHSSLNSNINHSNNNTLSDNTINKKHIKFASFLYKQCYETPYLPCGYYIKLILSSNYYKGNVPIEENDIKYFDIGFNKIEIYDEEGKNIINNECNNLNNNISDNHINYKIISNCEIVDNENEDEKDLNKKIIINGAPKENENNCLFYIFDKPVRISYIKFYPLQENNRPILNSAKEIKIFSDCKIIFEGDLYLDKPTVILFTCDRKIINNNISENYLTKEVNKRAVTEEKNEKYFSLLLK